MGLRLEIELRCYRGARIGSSTEAQVVLALPRRALG